MPRRLKSRTSVILGITGQVATGKSTVAALFAQLGAVTINADLIAHHALRPGGACYAKVIKTFGPTILKNGLIDHRELARKVFSNQTPNHQENLRKLERIIHPEVIRETKRQIRALKEAGKSVIVLDVPLLFESGMDQLADLTLTVTATKSQQIQRCQKQGTLSPAQVKARSAQQWALKDKVKKSDLVIKNQATRDRTRAQVVKIWEMLQRRYFQ